MLARYKIHRGRPPADEPLPNGIRQDTRKHTRHCLRPPAEIVLAFLAEPSAAAFAEFAASYLACLENRWQTDRAPFDALAQLAQDKDVYLGCSCPTVKNPDVNHCHTVLALRFMKQRYPILKVRVP